MNSGLSLCLVIIIFHFHFVRYRTASDFDLTADTSAFEPSGVYRPTRGHGCIRYRSPQGRPAGKFTAEAYITNLTDEVQEGNLLRGIGFMDCSGCGGQEFVTYNPPRQYGLTLGYRF